MLSKSHREGEKFKGNIKFNWNMALKMIHFTYKLQKKNSVKSKVVNNNNIKNLNSDKKERN